MWRTVILLLAVCLSAAVLLVPGVPLGIPGEWDWHRQNLPGDVWEAVDRLLWPLLVAACVAAFCRFADTRIATASRAACSVVLCLLACAAFCWLNGVRQSAASPHRELRPLWVIYDKYASGYFHEAAFRITSQHELLSTYEARMEKGDWLHEGTHPPGLFLLNWWALNATRNSETLTSLSEWTQAPTTVRFFRGVEVQAATARRLSRSELAALCLVSFLSSVAAAMTVIPVFGLVRMLSNRQSAWRAACLTISIPALAVFAPRSDIVYAFSATLTLWVMVAAILATTSRRRVLLAILAAGTIFLSLSVSLAHVPVIFAGALFSVLSLLGTNRVSPTRVLVTGGLMLAMFLLLCGAVYWATDCNLLNVWKMNLSNHARFYAQSPRTYWKWFLVNPIELTFAVGLPIALFSMKGIAMSARRTWSHYRTGSVLQAFDRLVISMAATWTILWLSGKNMGEAARLWCFLTPWFVIMTTVGAFDHTTHSPESGMPELHRRNARNQSQDWFWLLLAQLVVCTMTVGRVSGYLEL